MWSKDGKQDRDERRQPIYLLICANGGCGLVLQSERPHYSDRCPLCNAPMNCERA